MSDGLRFEFNPRITRQKQESSFGSNVLDGDQEQRLDNLVSLSARENLILRRYDRFQFVGETGVAMALNRLIVPQSRRPLQLMRELRVRGLFYDLKHRKICCR